jgi:DNA-binding PadR family transcriptional regulator
MVKRKPGGLTDNEARTLRAVVALHADGHADVYGFLLAEALAGQGGRATAYSALYDSLKRLERLGYLVGRWEDPDLAAAAKRPRRYLIRITGLGRQALAATELLAEAHRLRRAVAAGQVVEGA